MGTLHFFDFDFDFARGISFCFVSFLLLNFLALFFARMLAKGEGKGERKKIDRATTQCNVEGFF